MYSVVRGVDLGVVSMEVQRDEFKSLVVVIAWQQ